ncbi:hypothetical protein PCASD_15727 [Puccinia coronata f. sp. avenae]|uniref:Secreted protein n=1 Tax=Puccinia coronata f. sp. avenae TaxID=200324 RepID=A0A2N5SWN3_9BASI|nr:hypothetical protein PCASD_15727 [Puccinia coronata f. sp. avenae]
MFKPILFIISFSVLLPQAFSHSFILALDGANGVQSAGFGTRLTTRGQLHQYTGLITDKEIKDGTVGPCGRVFGGENMTPFVIDPQAELARAEASGISTAHKDGSIVMGVFVHNRDGAGPFHCDYSSDATLSSFEPMKINVQIEGVNGINNASDKYVYPLTAAFYPNSTCTGGKDRDTCIVRCRNPLGFGSCAALKLGEPAITKRSMSEIVQRAMANDTADTAPRNLTGNVVVPLVSLPHDLVNQTQNPSTPVAPHPDRNASRTLTRDAQPSQSPAPASSPSANPNATSNLTSPHDSNSPALVSDTPNSPAAAARRSLPKTKRHFLHE